MIALKIIYGGVVQNEDLDISNFSSTQSFLTQSFYEQFRLIYFIS